MGGVVLGLDVGTTGAKAMCVSREGKILGRSYRGYALQRRGGSITQEAEDWYSAVREIVPEAAGGYAGQVEAVSLSTQGGTLVLTDGSGAPLCPAVSWMDGSAVQAAREMEELVPLCREITGWAPGAWSSAAKLRQFGHGGAARILSTVEFVNHRLTGRFVCDPSNGAMQGLLDARTGDWSGEMLAFAGVSRAQMPDLVPSGEPAGRLTERAAEELGLPAGIPVFSGGHDQYCAALAAGLSDPGDLLISCGTAWVLLSMTDSLPGHGAWGRPLRGPGYGALSSIGSAGASMEWAGRLAGCTLSEADAGAAAAADAPFFHVGFGTAAGARLSGLELDHDRFCVVRAVMEGVAFEVRRRAEAFGNIARIFVNGGASRSTVWMQILADALGRPITVIEEKDLACVGAARLALLGLGCDASPVFARHDVLPSRDASDRYARWLEAEHG